MKRTLHLISVVFALALSMPARAHIAADEMMEAAKEFLAVLTPDQKAKAVFTMNDPERVNWAFVPKDRKGLSFKEMTKQQRGLVHGLLDSALSQRAYIKATTIISLENILHELENKNPRRDPELYYVSIFGEPSVGGAWGWRFEGHHLSINFTIVNNDLIAASPSFYGANPAEIKDGPKKGTRALAAEEDLGRQLVKALDEDQKKIAVFATEAPAEIITKNDRKASPLEPQGISFAQMNREQGELLLKLVKEYLARNREEIAEDDWKKIRARKFDEIYFAWAGGFEKGQKHYYRVQGPTFLLEYDNTQNDANHVHAAWRDFDNDFGDDILKKHYDEIPHDNADRKAKPSDDKDAGEEFKRPQRSLQTDPTPKTDSEPQTDNTPKTKPLNQ